MPQFAGTGQSVYSRSRPWSQTMPLEVSAARRSIRHVGVARWPRRSRAPSARRPSATSTCASPARTTRRSRPDAGDFVVREDDIAREIVRVAPAPPPRTSPCSWTTAASCRPMLIECGSSLLVVRRQHDRAAVAAADVAHHVGGAADAARRLHDEPTSRSSGGIKKIFPRPGAGSYFLDAHRRSLPRRLRKAEAPNGRSSSRSSSDASPEFSNRDARHVVADARRTRDASLWTVELQQDRSPVNVARGPRARARHWRRRRPGAAAWIRSRCCRAGPDSGVRGSLSRASWARYRRHLRPPASLVPPKRLVVETRDRKLAEVTAPRWTGQ